MSFVHEKPESYPPTQAMPGTTENPFMRTTTKEYQVTNPNYTHHYEIEYSWQDALGYYEIWVLYHPKDPWGKCDATHHLISTGKLCVHTGREPKELEYAEAIALYWAERFSAYIHTGKFVDDGATIHT